MSSLAQIRQEILDLSYVHTRSRVLSAGVSLGLFEALGKKWVDAKALSRIIKTDARATELLLNALCGLNLLSKKGHRYANRPFGRRLFTPKDPLSLHHIILLSRWGYHLWDRLDESIKSGKRLQMPPFRSDNFKAVEAFILAMHNTAIGHAPQLAKAMPLKNVRRLIDVGGGPGTFSIHFCKANPKLQVVVFDLPLTLRVTRRMIRQNRLERRMKTQAGDFLKGPIRGRFDAAFLSHIIHAMDEKKIVLLLKKVHGVLPSNGKIFIQDFFLDPAKTTPPFGALFALTMLVGSDLGGRSYSALETKDLLREAGFKGIKRLQARLPREISVLQATKP